jgi:hypothetical protein
MLSAAGKGAVRALSAPAEVPSLNEYIDAVDDTWFSTSSGFLNRLLQTRAPLDHSMCSEEGRSFFMIFNQSITPRKAKPAITPRKAKPAIYPDLI